MYNFKHIVEKIGMRFPQAPQPVGNYQATILAGKIMYVSGQLPFREGALIYKGQLGKELSVEEGRAAAELCALNLISQISRRVAVENLKQIVKIEGFINCSESFTEHAIVLNGASDLLLALLNEKAGHVRSVVGCNSLPLGAAVELSAIVELN